METFTDKDFVDWMTLIDTIGKVDTLIEIAKIESAKNNCKLDKPHQASRRQQNNT